MTPANSQLIATQNNMPNDPRRNPLEALFSPKSVAVIGATESPGSVGRAVFENLAAFSGPVFPVNPRRASILGKPAFPNISSLPRIPELAVIVTPAPTVPGIIRECVDAGVAAAVILSAGFKECGPEGTELERRVLAETRGGRLRVLGPNCLGLMIPHLGLNATFARDMAQPGSVAFLSQSGALCTAILDWSFRENVGFSAFVSMGSMVDVGWGEAIYHLGDDPQTRSIVCYMESVGDARAFLSAAREVALTKPIIVLKVGRTEAASKAAASHTGGLTGSDDVLDAAFRRAGVLRVDTLGELFDMAEVLGKQPRPRGRRLAIVTNAGGPGALATDMLVSSGGQLARLGPETIRALDGFLPPHWSHGNPVDILGDADAGRYGKAVALVAADPETDGVLAILTPQAMTDATATAERLALGSAQTDKPILASWMGGPSLDAGKAKLNAANIPTFDTADTASRAFALMWQYSDNLRALYETPSLSPPGAESQAGQARAKEIIDAARRSGRALLTEAESKQVLAAYGIPTVPTLVAASSEEAASRARELGFPVVVKLHSETLTHKSDVGGVHLDVRDEEGVRAAFRSIEKSVAERAGLGHFLGVTVQPMADRDGFELILGSSIDPQFGPVLLFGAGGKFVEIFKDTSLGLPPLNTTLAFRLMERTRIYEALKGVRGLKPVNLPALAQLLVRFSLLVAEQRGVAEIDINPLLVSAEKMVALDARIVLHPSDLPEERYPRLAIHPYPNHYVAEWRSKDGAPMTIRPIRPEDEPCMVKFHGGLSDRTVYLRYFTHLRLDERVAHERLSRLCFIDYDREMALVAEHRDPRTGAAEIVGVGRLSRPRGSDDAEFALLVSDGWQRRGLGGELLRSLVRIARDAKLRRLAGRMLADNLGMRRLAASAGFAVRNLPGETDHLAELVL